MVVHIWRATAKLTDFRLIKGTQPIHHLPLTSLKISRVGCGKAYYIPSIKKEKKKMEENKEMEEQLASMGFSIELAKQALAATGNNSIHKATEWILSHTSNNKSPIHDDNKSPFQPKLDRFFLPSNSKSSNHNAEPAQPKRPKLALKSLKPHNQQPHHHQPLSERMRPLTIHDVVGQEHILSPNSLLSAALECNRLPSIIFWGPPGTGKTSIAKSIVNSCNDPCFYRFVSLSAVTSGVKDVRDVVDDAKKFRIKGGDKRTVLFVDEVHRFNKSQQDSFLPVIEDGSIVFMGATTENPSFHLITPLLSRCKLLTLNPLKPHHVETLLHRAVHDSDRGLSKSVGFKVEVDDDVVHFLAANCDGDARVALNALEISATRAAAHVPSCSDSAKNVTDETDAIGAAAIVTLDDAKEALQCKHLAYDRAGDEHYNLISALHKSMRGGDADAAIYWLARMLQGGEQPLYIARRLIRFASEDVGLADPLALNQAVACYQACHFLGMPECNVVLAQCVAYLALAPKSVAVYRAIEAAEKVVKESVGQNEGVPLHLRNAPTKLMKELGYGKDYIYPPDNPSSTQSYLPGSLRGHKFLNWPTCVSTDPKEPK